AVGSRGRHVVGVRAGEGVGRDRRAGGGLTGLLVDGRNFVSGGDRLELVRVVADVFQRAEGHQLQAVTGGAHFLVNLEAALQLGAIVQAEDAFVREGHLLRRSFNRLDRIRLGGLTRSKGANQKGEREDRTHTVGYKTDHYAVPL